MSTIITDPMCSTDQVWRRDNMSQCLSDDLDAIEEDIAALENGKANSSHTHAASSISGLATVATSGSYNDLTDKPSGSGYTHPDTHPASMITGLAEVATSGDYNDLANKPTIPAAYTHPTSHPASMITGLADVATSGDYNDLSNKPTIPTVPSSLPADGGNADTVDNMHASDFATANHTHTVFPADSTLAAYKLVYIATNGDDSRDGFTQSNAMATIKGVIKKYADSYKALDIRLLDGTYTEDTWSISVDQCNLSIRSASENKDAVTLNITGNIESNVNKLRLYNMTINVTATNVRALSVTAGSAYAYNVRFNVPANSDASCVNVYNGASAFLMNCVLNAGTGTSAGAAVYGNQAQLIKVINSTSERTVNVGFHAHNGSDIYYTDTITAKTVKKETYYGKCTVR